MPTIKKSVKFSGVGIHSGAPVSMVVKPSKKRGIFFRRTDLGKNLIPAKFDNVGDTKMRNTTIGDLDSAHVKTIEHFMAAMFMAGIDSAIVDIDGPETPILDGSAIEFYRKISAAGAMGGKIKRIIVRRPIYVGALEVFRSLPFWTRAKIWFMNLLARRNIDGFVKLTPNDKNSLNIYATLVYREKIIGYQSFSYTYDGTKKSVADFVKNIARARTFGKYAEWEYLKKHGMARGANENNVIALNDAGDGTLNKTFWPDEFVRHKIIDAIGDMFTSGAFIVGNFESYKGSHAMNNMLLKKLFSNPDNYDIIDV
ncbi:MAG: UDP-3-O-acyl-N-acetylglucosamine deacetylase [Alphaproteobacteria bacterium]|nr:UDP-3-O-acyl-N-acetylglucosamine deacetylase [Alphaproteobacteria bacterium]